MHHQVRAIESLGGEVVILKEDKIVGIGRVMSSFDGEFVGVELTEGAILGMVENLGVVQTLGLDGLAFRYSPVTGAYLGTGFWDDEDSDAVLGTTFAVGRFNLSHGIVPDHFKNVEGYRSAVQEEYEALMPPPL